MIVALIIFSEVLSPANKINVDKETVITIEEFNKLSSRGVINYADSKYIKSRDLLYIIDLEGNSYVLTNASKRNLSENTQDPYYKNYFRDRESLGKLTSVSGIDTRGIVTSIISVSASFVVVWLIFKLITVTSNMGTLKDSGIRKAKQPDIKFENVMGHAEAKRDLKFIVDFMKHPDKYKKINARIPRGILFYGPPGTGKTLLAKAVAGEAGVPILVANGSDFIEKYVGVGAGRVRSLFKEARKLAPCIIFIDEIDAVAQKRVGGGEGGSMEHSQTLNALLSSMDGFEDNEGVLVIASTNRLELLDKAILRPGRFDRHIAIGYPDLQDRVELAKYFMQGKQISSSLTPEGVASQTYGFSGAMIENLINEAALITALNDKEEIDEESLSDAMVKVVTGGDKKETYKHTPEQQKLIAYHEAGHALAYRVLCKMPVHKVSIVPTTSGALGWTLTSPEDETILSKTDLENKVICLFAGRAAEELLLKDKNLITTGAGNDIEKATQIIKDMVTRYGFDSGYGIINLDILGVDDKEIIKVVSEKSKELYEKAVNLVSNNSIRIENIAERLLEKETIGQEELDEIIAEK